MGFGHKAHELLAQAAGGLLAQGAQALDTTRMGFGHNPHGQWAQAMFWHFGHKFDIKCCLK